MLIFKLKRILSKNKKFLNDKKFKIFGKRIYNPYIWYFNKYTISKGVSIGLFFAWMPVPLQMLFAAGFAILFKANLPVSIIFVWLTNPITMPILFLAAYKIGQLFFTVASTSVFKFELSFSWLFNKTCDIWHPFITGCFVCAIVSSILGNITVRLLWKFSILKNWRMRKRSKKKK